MFNYTHETIRFMSSMDTYEDKIDDSISHNYEHDEVVIFAPFLLLAIGAFLRHTTKSLPLPYTMQLLVLGSLLGIFLRRSEWDDALQQSVSKLGDMDPHLMLHIFLPPLVFESAASIEWHLFTKAKWYIISLAGPGLLLASGLTGYVINILLGQSERFSNEVVTLCPSEAWSAQAALMLGVIMSATDPVAVVALLKDLGCKASLATAIEGESLLNDGTALVLYTILVKIVEGDSSDNWGDYFVTFIKMSFGGALFGTTFALIVVQWLRMIFNDAMSEITITLAAAYLCFFIAEYFLHISGVIAVVCLGLYFGHSGRTSVSPEVGHFLGEFWELLAYFGNTLIFVVAGTVIGYKLPSFPWWDFVQMIIMYIACTIIRATVVGIIYFIFRQCGAELEKEDQVIAIWAGLRGAVGLSLAMMVFSNSKICEPIREIVMFHTAGIVVLTVCINSTTIPKVVNLLGLDAIVPSKQLIYDQAMTNIIAAGKKQESNIRADHMFDSAVWEEARHYYFRTNSDDKIKNRRGTSTTLAEKELRRRVLMITKKSYWRQFQDGLLSNHSVKYLTHHTDIAIDNDCTLNEWQTYVELNRLGSRLDKSTDKLIASEASSNSEKQRVKLLNFLDSVPVILTILLLVFASCILPFTIDETSRAFLIIENSTTAIFITELLIRLYCLQDWNPCAVDPYIAIDVLAVLLDILLLSAEDVLGVFSEFSKSIRSIRFLRLFRLLRLARLANRLNKVKIAGERFLCVYF
jgi:NhaP-type Na+/H+ or K+/H+ antiporter